MKPAGYLRVSDPRQVDKWSLGAQEHAIRERCEREGWPAPALYREDGRSAFDDDYTKRPQFMRLLTDVEAGRVDTVLIVDTDRLARSIIAATTAAKRLEAAGCRVVSFDLPLDIRTSTGWMMFSVKSAFAELESRRKSERVLAANARKRAAGHWLGGIPFGARLVDGRPAIDPAHAATLRLLLERAAEASAYAVAAELSAAGIPPPGGRRRGGRWPDFAPAAHWWPSTVRDIVARGRWLLDQPDPWPRLWLAARARADLPRVRADRRVRMLSGLMRCPCGASLQYGSPRGPRGRLNVQCHGTRVRGRAGGCPFAGTRTYADVYEEQVTAALMALPEPEEWRDADDAEGIPLERALAELAEDRLRLAASYRARLYTHDQFEIERLALDAREVDLVREGGRLDELRGEFRRLRLAWAVLPPPAQNDLLREMVLEVRIEGKVAVVVWVPELAAAIGNPA